MTAMATGTAAAAAASSMSTPGDDDGYPLSALRASVRELLSSDLFASAAGMADMLVAAGTEKSFHSAYAAPSARWRAMDLAMHGDALRGLGEARRALARYRSAIDLLPPASGSGGDGDGIPTAASLRERAATCLRHLGEKAW